MRRPSEVAVPIIRSDAEFLWTEREIARLMDTAEPGTADGDRLEALIVVYKAFEATRYARIPPPSAVDAIRFRMEQQGYTRKDLMAALGTTRGRVAEILSGRRELSKSMLRRLHVGWGIPAESLLG